MRNAKSKALEDFIKKKEEANKIDYNLIKEKIFMEYENLNFD